MTFRDVLGGGPAKGVPWHTHDGADISGEIVASTIKAERFLGGVITGEEFIIAGGVDGIIRSDNFVAGADGWIFRGDGSGEINDLIVRGDIESGNWDGTSPANLATPDTGATAGFYLDSSVGSQQLMGNLFVGGNIELFDGDGIFRSAASDEPRVEIGFTDFAGIASGSIDFYTTDDIEGGSPGTVYKGISITGGEINSTSAILQFDFFTDAGVKHRQARFGTLSSPAFDAPAFHLINAAGTDFAGEFVANYFLSGTDGTAALPVYGWWDELDTGMYLSAANAIGLSTGGARRLNLNSAGLFIDVSGSAVTPSLRLNDADTGFFLNAPAQLGVSAGGTARMTVNGTRVDIVNTSFLSLPVKTDTGDPSSPADGDMYVNTSDNVLRLRADGAWHTVFSY